MTAHRARATGLNTVALVGVLLAVTACHARLGESEPGRGADVDIRTPIGGLSVRTGGQVPDTGLSVYAGARPLSEQGETHNANVSIDTPLFGLQVAAAKFESSDTPTQVLDFYRAELRKYGEVLECRGEVDFRGRGERAEPHCRDGRRSKQVQLVVGKENHHRMVAVESRGGDTEFSLIHVDTRNVDW